MAAPRSGTAAGGATKVKLAAPKSKYVEHILIATHAGEAGIAEVFRALNNRLKDQTWTIVFKSLILVHLMIREGEREVTLRYLRRHPRSIAVSTYSDAQEQGRNIRHYSHYLLERARTYGDVRTDYVRSGEGRLRKLSIEKGLLREVECVQTQIEALLKCTFLDDDVDNEISLLAFRLLVMDLLVLFHVVNEGVINVLEHYFEMSRYDAQRALGIYKSFTKQTAEVVEYLQQARRVESATRLQIPNLKHAPTSLTASLEEYLHDPDFDANRRQYLAQQEAKRTGGKVPTSPPQKSRSPAPAQQSKAAGPDSTTVASSAQPVVSQQPKIAPDLIDFFESIETEQTPMFGNPQQVPPQVPQIQTPYAMQGAVGFDAQGQFIQQPVIYQQNAYPATLYRPNPYQQPPQMVSTISQNQPFPQQVATNFTGNGFGGYTPPDQSAVYAPPVPTIPQQFIPVQQPPSLQLPQTLSAPQSTGDTNPFRQSMMLTGSSTPTTKPTNPFARGAASPPTSSSPFPSSPPQTTPLRSASTGTNPFARNLAGSAPAQTSLLVPTPTGTTNPFRLSMLAQQQQAQQVAMMNGNFSGQTGTMGGWENVETVPIFPRDPVTGAPTSG
ncbi:hypothetical protein RUND412_005010 [Rhizina undulata]